MLGLSIVPAVLQFLGFFFFLPESPRWLLQKGDSQQAREVLMKIRATESVDEEYDCIKGIIEEEEKEAGGKQHIKIQVLTRTCRENFSQQCEHGCTNNGAVHILIIPTKL